MEQTHISGNTIEIASSLDTANYFIAAAAGISTGAAGVGATLVTTVLCNKILSRVGDAAIVTSSVNTNTYENRQSRRAKGYVSPGSGVLITAKGGEEIAVACAAIGAASTAASARWSTPRLSATRPGQPSGTALG